MTSESHTSNRVGDCIRFRNSIVGNTSIRRCAYLSSIYNTNIFIKEEFHNAGMSSKDRPALFMIEEAIKNNKIRKNATLVEASSGNTGISIALLANKLGFKSRIFVPAKTSKEKIDILKSAGAVVVLCNNSNGLRDPESTQFCAQSYANSHPTSFFTNQYYNPQNINAHFATTGPEVWEQTGFRVTHFIAGIGTGGTLSGTGKFLKMKNKEVLIWGVEPIGSVLTAFLKTGQLPDNAMSFESIEGLGRNFVPGSFDPNYIDDIFQVGLEETKQAALEYRANAGFLAGYSSAALLATLNRYSKEMMLQPHHTVVLLFPDHGSRYLSKLYVDSVIVKMY